MTIWDCRRLNHKVLGTHTGHLFYCKSWLKEAIKTFSHKWIFYLPNTSEFKIPLSWHCERACGWEESSCKCFEGMQWKAKEVFQLRLGLPHSFVMTGSWNWRVNESWWNTWYTLVCQSLTQTFYGQAIESVHFSYSHTIRARYEIIRSQIHAIQQILS